MTNTTLEKCAGCLAEPGSAHEDGCDWAKCPDCGEQLLMCCHQPNRPAMWHGIDPRAEVAHAKDWWTDFPDLGRVEDYTRVLIADANGEISWNPETQRYNI